jgi:hypothetical protein
MESASDNYLICTVFLSVEESACNIKIFKESVEEVFVVINAEASPRGLIR